MNPHKYFASAELMSNPLCGIDTYKDILNLATGQITKNIKKYEFTGQESDLRIQPTITSTNAIQVPTTTSDYKREPFICSHMEVTNSSTGSSTHGFYGQFLTLCFDLSMGLDTLEKVRNYLQQQYAAEIPVTVWYVLTTSETEQITVPSGLSGTVEGSLIQDGTPTPEAPIYPTANTAKGWYNINAYKRSVLVWDTDTAYERSDGSWT